MRLIFPYNQPLKKLLDKFLGCMKSLHTLALIFSHLQLPHDLKAVHLVFHVSMLDTSIPESNSESDSTNAPTLISKTNLIQNFDILDPRLTTDVAAQLQYLSKGRAMKARLMKKPLGSMPMSLGMLPNLLQTFTWPYTNPFLGLSQIIEVQTTSLLLKFSHLLQVNKILLLCQSRSLHQYSQPHIKPLHHILKRIVLPLEHSLSPALSNSLAIIIPVVPL